MNKDKLKQLGLTEYEARAYLALLKLGVQQGRDVAKHADLPPTRVFDALHSLVARGFASKVQDKPLLFKAAPPSIAINHLIASKQENLRILKEDLVENLSKVKSEEIIPKTSEKITILPGYEALWNFVDHSLETAEKEIKLMFTFEQRSSRPIPALKKAIARGVKVYIIATKLPEESRDYIQKFIDLGAQIKYYPVEEIRVTVKDRKESLITMLNPRDKSDRVNLIINSLELSKAMDSYFDALWMKAKVINKFGM